MKSFLKNAFNSARRSLGMFALVAAAACAVSVFSGNALATDPISDTVTTLGGYWTDIQAVAITVVLFVLGRRFLRKI